MIPLRCALLTLSLMLVPRAAAQTLPPQHLNAEMQRLMTAAKVPGLALAVIEDGKVSYRQAYGKKSPARRWQP